MPKVIVSDICPENWDSLVERCTWGTFYHTSDYLRLIEPVADSKAGYICAFGGEELTGGIPFMVCEGPLGAVVNCLPYFGSFGEAVIAPNAPDDTLQHMYHTLIAHCRDINALSLTVITSPFASENHNEDVKAILCPTFVDSRICQITHLPEYSGETEKEYMTKIMASLQGRARTAYRKILDAGMKLHKAETKQDMLDFADLHIDNIQKKNGSFHPEEFFHNAFQLLNRKPAAAEFSMMTKSRSSNDSTLTAGAVYFYFRDTVQYYATCLHNDYRSIGPMNRIIVEKMVEAGMSGLRYFNFGGTWKSQEGVYRFKQSFGAVDHSYFYNVRIFRDLEKLIKMSQADIAAAYPFFYVIPFSELEKNTSNSR